MIRRTVFLRPLVLCCCLLSLPHFASGAGEAPVTLLARALQELGAGVISYDYSVQILDPKTRRNIDQVDGRLWKTGLYYKDSNRVQINLRDDKYTVQVCPGKSAIYVKSIRNLKQAQGHESKMTVQPAPEVTAIKTEQIRSSRTWTDTKGVRHISCVLQNAEFISVAAAFDAQGHVRELELVSSQQADANTEIHRRLSMSNINVSVSKTSINAAHYIREKGRAIMPARDYSSYHIVQLI